MANFFSAFSALQKIKCQKNRSFNQSDRNEISGGPGQVSKGVQLYKTFCQQRLTKCIKTDRAEVPATLDKVLKSHISDFWNRQKSTKPGKTAWNDLSERGTHQDSPYLWKTQSVGLLSLLWDHISLTICRFAKNLQHTQVHLMGSFPSDGGRGAVRIGP